MLSAAEALRSAVKGGCAGWVWVALGAWVTIHRGRAASSLAATPKTVALLLGGV
jgi:hypothetical protein